MTKAPQTYSSGPRLATELSEANPDNRPTWLDYGCGKGGFMAEIQPLALFAMITGHDPAVDAFRARPDCRHDLVTCLDVLDVVEPRFLEAIVAEVCDLTAGLAVFDYLTRPKPLSGLRPHAPFYWSHLIRRHMEVSETIVEFPGRDGFERAVIVAAPPARRA